MVIGSLGVSSIVLAWTWAGLILLADRVLGVDWKAPGPLNLTCLLLGALTCSCFGATIALVMAGFAGPPAVTTTIGVVTDEGGTGWPALDRFGRAALTFIGWSAALCLGVLAILAWLAVVVAAWRLVFRVAARPGS